MKLYIPTTTLNIDNILSTECIAPSSFYKGRDYGYNNFYPIQYIPYTNVLLLFSGIPNFQINDSEHHAFPLVIEVDFPDSINNLKQIGEVNNIKIYTTDDVVRLTPYNARILFFNPKGLSSAKLSCSDSLTNKLGERFRFNLCKAEFELQSALVQVVVEDVCNEYESKVIRDNRLNKVKGFIYGYYLGISKSLSANSAKLLKIQRRIYDIVDSIKNEGSYNSNAFQDELLKLDSEYRKNDPVTKQCREEWEKYLNSINIPIDALDALLEKYDENSFVKLSFMKKNGFTPSVSIRQYGLRNLEDYRNALTAHTVSIVNSDRKKALEKFAASIKQTFDLDPSYETCMLANEDDETNLYNKFIARIIWNAHCPTPESLRTNRFNIATEITRMTKSIWEDSGMQWHNSSAQEFMNDLRQNIKNFTPLDINGHENIILKSVAIYILKGEDYESLVQFCEDNLINDYRYALALWGATQGYVKISRPIVSSLFKSAVFGSTLKEIIYLLHNIESVGEFPFVQEPITIEELPNKTVFPQFGKEQTAQDDLCVWQDGIRKYFGQLKRVQKKEDLMAALEQAFVENGTQTDYVHFFAILNDYTEWKTAKGEPIKAWKEMVEHFCPTEYSNRFGCSIKQDTQKKPNKTLGQKVLDLLGITDEKNQESVAQRTLVTETNIRSEEVYYFYNDPKTITELNHIIGDSVKDVMWIFDDLKRLPDDRKYYKHVDVTDNKFVIDTFCKSKRNKEHPVIGPKLERIRQHFYNKYGIR